MASARLNTVLRHLHAAAFAGGGGGVTDAQLLDRYLAHRDEAAFEALLRRHGPMVLGVCRRVLQNAHDAEDAFQATFLVLVRKAASVVPRGMVGNWLHGVAYRTSMKARTMNAKRRLKERAAGQVPRPNPEPGEVWSESRPVLDQELDRLPVKYRAPLVLCGLEGKTREEAARQLGWPEGTVATRLVKARSLLARGLARRGVAISWAAMAVTLEQQATAAEVPAALITSTIQASRFAASSAAAAGLISVETAALTEGVLKAMSMSKLRAGTCVVLTAGVLTLGTLFLNASPQAPAPQQDKMAPAGYNPFENLPRGGKAAGFLEVGKNYEFVLAQSQRSIVGKVLAVRGDSWVNVRIRDGNYASPGPAWINLQHVLLVGENPGDQPRGREQVK